MVRLVAKANKTAQVFLCLNLSRTTVSCMYRDGCYDTCSYDFHTFLWQGLRQNGKIQLRSSIHFLQAIWVLSRFKAHLEITHRASTSAIAVTSNTMLSYIYFYIYGI